MPEASHPYRGEPRAIQLARRLQARWGRGSVEEAHFQFLESVRRGKIARADLYHAVWAVLQHRHNVTSFGAATYR